MFRKHLRAATHAAGRIVPPLGLAATVLATTLATTLAPTTIARADVPDEPVSRIQIIVHSAHIYNDHEGVFSGSGEIGLFPRFRHLEGPQDRDAPYMVASGYRFSASSGDDVSLEKYFPWERDTMNEGSGIRTGIPVFQGKGYTFTIHGQEEDPWNPTDGTDWTAGTDYLGDATLELTAANNWGVGSHSVRSRKSDGKAGDFEVTFEIRTAALPDLRPVKITTERVPGSNQTHVCTTVENVGIANPGTFQVAVQVDGTTAANGVAIMPQLLSGTSGEVCVDTSLPTTGKHTLSAYVDAPKLVTEVNDANNLFEQPYTPTSTAAVSTDLVVSTLRINGQKPDGNDDCTDGKNDIQVTVKNGGMTIASKVGVQLSVDGAQVGTQTVAMLAPGNSADVRFVDVQLKKGQHVLIAALGSGSHGSKLGTDTNGLKANATCKAAA